MSDRRYKSTAGIPARNDYFLSALFELSLRLAELLPLPRIRRNAAASRNVGNFVSNAEQVDCRRGVAAASDGKTPRRQRDGIRHDFSPFTEVRELKHANRRSTEWVLAFLGFPQPAAERKHAYVRDPARLLSRR